MLRVGKTTENASVLTEVKFSVCVCRSEGDRKQTQALIQMGFPGGSAGKESACNVGDLGLIPGLARSPGKGTGYPSSVLAWKIQWTVCSLPGSSVHGILQARILDWLTILFSRGSCQPRDQTQVSCITGRLFIIRSTRKVRGCAILCV